jgi:tetratricopeptide (TPR) repeat protein
VQARLLATMGMAYTSQGAYQASLSLFQRALELRKATLGPDDLDTVASMDDMGEAYRELNRFDEAESMHREALAAKQRLGAPPSSVAASLNNVGLTLSERGRGDAGPCCARPSTCGGGTKAPRPTSSPRGSTTSPMSCGNRGA